MRAKLVKPGHRRILLGAASALILSVAAAGTAHASESCDAISGANYNNANTQQGVTNVQLNNGQQFAFDPGDTVTVTITVPPSTRATVFVQGVQATVDNSGNAASSRTETIALVIPESSSGGGDTGPVAIQVVSSSGGGTVNVDFNCTNAPDEPGEPDEPDEPDDAAIDPRRFGGQVDNVVQSIVPGGANGGNLFGDFGVPLDPFLTVEGVLRGNERACDDELERARAAFKQAQERASRANQNRQEAINSAREAAREAADAIRARVAAQNALDAAEKESSEERNELLEASAAFPQTLEESIERDLDAATLSQMDTRLENAKRALEAARIRSGEAEAFSDMAIASQVEIQAKERAAKAQQALAEAIKALDDEVAEAEQALADANAELDRARVNCEGGAPSAFFPVSPTSARPAFAGFSGSLQSAVAAIDGIAGRPNDIVNASFMVLGYASAPVQRVTGGVSLAEARATAEAQGGGLDGLLGDPRFNAWVNGGVTFHLDNSSIGQDGETINVSTGVSYLIDPRVNIGLTARFGHTDRSGATGQTIADTWSLGAFTQVKLPDDFALSAMLAYSLVNIDADTIQGALTASGQTNAKSLAGQLSLSKPFEVEGWTLSPNAGVSFVNIERDAFTASDGTFVGGSNSTQVSAMAGINASTRFDIERANGETIGISPSFGLSGFYNLGRFDPLVGSNGEEITAEGFGLVANAGLAMQFAGGASLGLNSSLSGLTSERKNLSVSARFNLPF